MNVKMSISALLLFFVMVMSLAGCGGGGETAVSAGNSSSSSVNGSTGGASSVGSKGVIKLSWNPPQPETGIVGYKVYYGTSSGTYTSSINVGMTPSYTLSGLAPGTYYFTVTAIYAPGNEESIYSNEASQTIS